MVGFDDPLLFSVALPLRVIQRLFCCIPALLVHMVLSICSRRNFFVSLCEFHACFDRSHQWVMVCIFRLAHLHFAVYYTVELFLLCQHIVALRVLCVIVGAFIFSFLLFSFWVVLRYLFFVSY